MLLLSLIPSVKMALAGPQPTGHVVRAEDRAGTMSRADRIPEAKLTLRIYNYAKIDPVALAESEKVASAIFENAGVEIAWMNCALSQAQIREYPGCQSEMGSSDLVVRILPHSMAMKLGPKDGPLGSAQLCPENEPACELNIFYQRVDELATKGYLAEMVLGHVLAHEAAHVLIGSGHAESGIMRGEWSREDLRRISWGMLLDFTKSQSSQLRAAVQRRAMQH